MRILKFEKKGDYTLVRMLFEDNTAGTAIVSGAERDKEEILKDAYIMLKNSEREEYTEESWTPPAPIPTSIIYNSVYDQYGDKMLDKVIELSIEGTDKAKIINGEIVEDEVKEDTAYTLIKKCEKAEVREERIIYAPSGSKTEMEQIQEKIDSLQEVIDVLIMGGE